jgi:hypothetical protein
LFNEKLYPKKVRLLSKICPSCKVKRLWQERTAICKKDGNTSGKEEVMFFCRGCEYESKKVVRKVLKP